MRRIRVGLLRTRRNGPRRRRAAEQRDELSAFHSITSSARASSDGGTFDPERAFAVLEVDDQFELCRLLNWDFCRLCSRRTLST